MPFQSQIYPFNDPTINLVNEVGGVYGLLQPSTRGYVVGYVGESDNLRRRLREHFNNPPVRGITHFCLEVIQGPISRAMRERALISEFNPPGNTVGTR